MKILTDFRKIVETGMDPRLRDRRLHSFLEIPCFFKGTIGTHTLWSDLFDEASLSRIQSNMILTVFCFDVQISLE